MKMENKIVQIKKNNIIVSVNRQGGCLDSIKKDGYVVSEWLLDGKPFDISIPITSDISLKAKWVKDNGPKYTITFDTDGGSSIKEQIVKANGVVKKPTNPTKAGYAFKEWQLNGETYNFKTKVTGDITLKAIWVDGVEVTFDTDGGSKIAKQIIEKGTPVKKPTDPTKNDNVFVLS